MIRAVGVSRYSLAELEEATRCIDLSVAQYPLSIFDRWFGTRPVDEYHRTAPILEFCRERGIGVMAYGGVAKGLLTGKFAGNETFPEGDRRRQFPRFQRGEFGRWVEVVKEIKPIAERYGRTLAQLAINWTLCQPGVVTALVGARTPGQVADNTGASGWRLASADLEEIEKIVARIDTVSPFVKTTKRPE